VAGTNWPAVAESELPVGAVVTSNGRVSVAREETGEPMPFPFTQRDRLVLDNALTDAIRRTGVRFSVYLGDLGADTASGVDAVFPTTPDAEHSVLIAVSPNQRAVEIRSGRAVADRANDRVVQLGVTAAVSAFKESGLMDGLISAVRVMAAAIAR
jgi:hypothetical protein